MQITSTNSILLHSRTVKPQDSGGKFMYLAQLQQGMEALESFRQGLNLLKRDLDSVSKLAENSSSNNSSGVSAEMLKRQLCTGYCR